MTSFRDRWVRPLKVQREDSFQAPKPVIPNKSSVYLTELEEFTLL